MSEWYDTPYTPPHLPTESGLCSMCFEPWPCPTHLRPGDRYVHVKRFVRPPRDGEDIIEVDLTNYPFHGIDLSGVYLPPTQEEREHGHERED